MGYYTKYELKIINRINYDYIKSGYCPIIAELITTYDLHSTLHPNGKVHEEDKWYDHEYHMKEFSKKYDNFTFELHGRGEDGNIWKKYFKNGKMQICVAIISFEEFDENKLE